MITGDHTMDFPCQVESGLQLLARLGTRRSLSFVHPELFKNGPNFNDVIELSYDLNSHHTSLLCEIISNALLPKELAGKDSGVVLLETDGQFDLIQLVSTLNCFIRQRNDSQYMSEEELECYVESATTRCLDNLHILQIYDSPQMYITIQNLENILSAHDKISLLIVDTISAFYWADRMTSSSLLKMDTYIKKLLRTLQTATKEYKSVILFTRPSYFLSKSSNESLDLCVEEPALEKINYRISLSVPPDSKACNSKEDVVQVSIANHQSTIVKNFTVNEFGIKWT